MADGGAPGAGGPGGAGAPAGAGGARAPGALLGRPMAAAGRLFARAGSAAAGAALRRSRGSVAVDLRCPGWKALKRAQERERRAGGGPGAGAARPERWTDHLRRRGGGAEEALGAPGGGLLDGGGVRVKVYRHWTAWEDPESGSSLMDVALGASFDTADGGSLEPRVRVRFGKIARLRLLPAPAFQAKKVVPLAPLLGAAGRGLALEACWSTPLTGLSGWEDLLQPPAGLYVRLRNASGAGPQLTARGLAFDERVAHAPSRSELSLSGGLDFPQQLPPPDSEGLFAVHLDRLRITTQIP